MTTLHLSENLTKRFFDLAFSIFAMIIFFPIALLVALLVKLTSDGPILYWSDRVGKYNVIFEMPKFRTMTIGTPPKATHLFPEVAKYLTPAGSFLRKSSLDELPQLWSILIGDMSFVGPRPALFNQYDLISLRTEFGINELVPGLTGWAQVNGRDDLSISVKVRFEAQYKKKQSFWFDMKILGLSFIQVIKRSGVSH